MLEDEGRFFLEFRFFWCGSNSVYFGVLERFVKGVSYDVLFALAQIVPFDVARILFFFARRENNWS